MTTLTTITLNPQFTPEWESAPVLSLSYPFDCSIKDGASQPNGGAHNSSLENIIIGRGHFTAVLDTHISREVCSVEFLVPQKVYSSLKKRKSINTDELENTNYHQAVVPILRMLKSPDEHKFEINDVKVSVKSGDYVHLNDGDIIRIHSSRPYRYRVTFKPPPPPNLSDKYARTHIPSAPLLPPVCRDIVQKAASNLWDDIKCPICYEIYVESHAANPCGHIFCISCVRNWIGNSNPIELLKTPIECPSCRMMINSFTLVRQYDSMIWNMLLCRPFPQDNNLRDDVLIFLQRCGKDVSSLSSEEHECLFGSRVKVSDAHSLKSRVE